MNSNLSKAIPSALLLLGGVGAACAQIFEYDPYCWDPSATTHYSADFNAFHLENELWGSGLGISGTVGYKFCHPGADNVVQVPVRGRFGFNVGSLGSVQDDDRGQPIDNGMLMNWAMNRFFNGLAQSGSGWSYARVMRQDADGTNARSTLFGANPFTIFFPGVSGRYIYVETNNDGVNIKLRLDVIGDGARFNWRFRNDSGNPTRIGLWLGQWVRIGREDETPSEASLRHVYVTVPGDKPVLYHQARYNRATNPAGFPNHVDFGYTNAVTFLSGPEYNPQKQAYGLRVVNGPTPEVSDDQGFSSEQTPVDEFAIGDIGNLLAGSGGDVTDPNFSDQILPDAHNPLGLAYLQKWEPAVVPATTPGDPNSGTRVINSFYKSVTGVSSFTAPFSAVVDTPKVLATDDANTTVFEQNPFRIRVYVDNAQGFAKIDQEVPLKDVKITVNLPQGLADANDPTKRTIVKFLNEVPARQMRFLDFPVVADDTVSGYLDYTVKIEPVPGPGKTISGRILAETTPRLLIRDGANLVTAPWRFSDTTWESILDPLNVDQDFQAFTWDAVLKQYVIQTGPERGKGTWLLSNQDLGYVVLQANPQQPNDQFLTLDPASDVPGAGPTPPLLQLKSGWNLIANPFTYPIELGQLVGVTAANPRETFTWQELVQQGIVSGSLAYWDAQTNTYKFIQGLTDKLEVNRGYWMFVTTLEDFTLSFPYVYEPFTRQGASWKQSEKQWRLQVAVRSEDAVDDQNYIGQLQQAKDLPKFRAYEPPMAPLKTAISAAIVDRVKGQDVDFAHAYTDKTGRHEWTLKVTNRKEGAMTVTWPNMSTLPKNIRFRLIDKATGAARDMRKSSGYTFNATENSSREFTIQSEPGLAPQPVIGSVFVTRATKDIKGPVTINYTLATDATTSIRILRANGREVYVATRGRSDRAGQNQVVWNLRDAANRAVPPGTYNVEVVAEGDSGTRVRRIVPITVIR